MYQRLLAGLVAVLLVSGASTALSQSQRIGLYSDTEGSGCSLTDTAPGFFQVFLVVLSPEDLNAVEFQVVADPGFTAVLVGELSPLPKPGVDGDAHGGMILAFGECYTMPLHVYTLTYQGFGTSGSCAGLDIGPNPNSLFDSIRFGTCDFNTIHVPQSAVDTFHLNPDGSCPCGLPVPVETSTWGQIKAMYR
jgi:hypothetical protein